MINLKPAYLILLTPRQRRQAAWLFILMLLGALVETAGVGLIIPALALMLQKDPAASYSWLRPLLDFLGQPTQKQLFVSGMAMLFVVYFFKALYLAFLAWRQNSFIFGVRTVLSQRLFTSYLRQPWSFHLQRNSAQLINTLTNETNLFTASALQPFLQLMTEALVVISICTLLIIVEPWGTLVLIIVLGFSAWSFQRLTNKNLLRWGKARQHHESLRIQHLQQGLGGAKDVKLLGREADFLKHYNIHNIGTNRAVELQNTMLQLPRLWIEVMAVGGLAVLVLVLTVQGKPLETILQIFGLFAVAAFRIMPSVSRVINTMQSLLYTRPVTEKLCQEFSQLNEDLVPEKGRPFKFCSEIALEGVNFRYPASATTALSNISLNIPHGTTVGIVGGSGAGKSTLVDIVLGLLTPTSGHVRVDGEDIKDNLRGWQDHIGYVPQVVFLTDDSLRRNVAFGLNEDQIDEGAVLRALHAAQLNDFVNTLPQGLETLVGERGVRLSGGQRQRIGIARALYHDPEVLVLDEATSSLDNLTEEDVMSAVNTLIGKKTLIIVAHRLTTVRNCDFIVELNRRGVVAQGSYEQLLECSPSFREMARMQ